MLQNEHIVGIDLGTTNSEIAVFIDGKVKVIGSGGEKMLPSCIGLSKTDDLLIGTPAKNQQLLYPERTVRSIKRKMGQNETIPLGNRTFSPQELSSLLLRELVEWANNALETNVRKAVISVPAYFSDTQRNATREAGTLAGLEVVRILNEPTAASLAYGYGSDKKQTVMIYDLGGGTFDVSIVTIEKEVTEVLASHGNNHLGGDDIDKLVVDYLLRKFRDSHDIDLDPGNTIAHSRLYWAAETAKRKLSAQPFVTVREDALATIDGKALHLEVEISREAFENMIGPLVESTLESVSTALQNARMTAAEIDAILLVGGSTRIPLISKMLRERTNLTPRHDIHPDLCVALGAGVLASRLSGHDIERILVDVSPYSFGPSYLGEREGLPYPYCYHPIIHANTPLPVTRTEKYYTSAPYQKEVEIDIYQGDNPDALKNIPIGHFTIKGLKPKEDANTVLCKMHLDIDGILKVTAIEKETGKSKQITIDNALRPKSEAEIADLKEKLKNFYASRTANIDPSEGLLDAIDVDYSAYEDLADSIVVKSQNQEDPEAADPAGSIGDDGTEPEPEFEQAVNAARKLIERSRRLIADMHDDDKEEAIEFHAQIESAIQSGDQAELSDTCGELEELLFFVEGK